MSSDLFLRSGLGKKIEVFLPWVKLRTLKGTVLNVNENFIVVKSIDGKDVWYIPLGQAVIKTLEK